MVINEIALVKKRMIPITTCQYWVVWACKLIFKDVFTWGFPSTGSCVVCKRVCLELQLCSRHMMVMDESCSLPERGTELNWKVLLIPPVTASESSLLEIDLSQGGLCGKKKAAISSWWEGMIRFVLSLVFFLCWCQQITSALSLVNTRSLLSSQS